MMTPMIPMDCERFAGALADYLDRDVDEATRLAMEAHAQDCGECGPLLADIRALRVKASSLPELVPSRNLWNGIAQRIETQVVDLKSGASVPKAARRWHGAW